MRQFEKSLLIMTVCFISVFFLTAFTNIDSWGIDDSQDQKDYSEAYVYLYGMFWNQEEDRANVFITNIEPVIFADDVLNGETIKDDFLDRVESRKRFGGNGVRSIAVALEEGELEREDIKIEVNLNYSELEKIKVDYWFNYLPDFFNGEFIVLQPDIYPEVSWHNGKWKLIE